MQYDPAHPKHDNLIYALGQLSIWFNLLESHVLLETWNVVTNGRDMGNLVTKGMNFDRLVDLLAAAYILRVPDRENEIKQLRSELKAVNTERNKFLHGIYAPGDDPMKVVKLTRGAKRTAAWVGPEIESVDDLGPTIAAVLGATEKIRHLGGQVADLPKMLPASGQPTP